MTEEQAAALLSAVAGLHDALAEIYVLLCVALGAFLAFALVCCFSHFFKH